MSFKSHDLVVLVVLALSLFAVVPALSAPSSPTSDAVAVLADMTAIAPAPELMTLPPAIVGSCGTAAACDDGDECTVDRCDGQLGCVHGFHPDLCE